MRAHTLTIGAVQVADDGQPDPHVGIVHLVRHADLVIDTAADPAVSRYLAAICAASRRPFLHASATAGAHGGIVTLIAAEGAGCWWCLLHRRHDQALPVPPAADQDTGTVVPAGCTAPTFTGTGADLDTIAGHAACTAITHLTGDRPTRASVLYVAALRDPDGRPGAGLVAHPTPPPPPRLPDAPPSPDGRRPSEAGTRPACGDCAQRPHPAP